MNAFNKILGSVISVVPKFIIKKISGRYIAGETVTAAMDRVCQLQNDGYLTTLDILGETVTNEDQLENVVSEYISLIDELRKRNLNSEISLKLTALGLSINRGVCRFQLKRILEAASRMEGVSVFFDMEDVSYTQNILELYSEIRSTNPDTGIAIQAYLNRSYNDIENLAKSKSKLRICKGIYNEDKHHLVDGASEDRGAINKHFFKHFISTINSGCYVCIATHDEYLINMILEWVDREKIENHRFEFQMLLGVCEPLRQKLKLSGFRVRVYVPYGRDWYGYSIRRIKENPLISGYLMKSLFKI